MGSGMSLRDDVKFRRAHRGVAGSDRREHRAAATAKPEERDATRRIVSGKKKLLAVKPSVKKKPKKTH